MRYDPAHGLFPRGFAGATETLAAIDLVLCLAEPGEPAASARPQPIAAPHELPEVVAISVARAFQARKSAFHDNVGYLLDCCWPDLPFEARMRRTWITEGVLCSAAIPADPVPRAVERECASRY